MKWMSLFTSEWGESAADTNEEIEVLTQATQMATLSLSKVCLVPNRAITASPIRHIMIHVATTTAGPWSLAVIVPCGGKEPPLPWNSRTSGKCESDIDNRTFLHKIVTISVAQRLAVLGE